MLKMRLKLLCLSLHLPVAARVFFKLEVNRCSSLRLNRLSLATLVWASSDFHTLRRRVGVSFVKRQSEPRIAVGQVFQCIL